MHSLPIQAATAAFLLAASALAAPQEPSPEPAGLAVHCGKLYVGDGRVLENVWLVVRDGRIEDVRAKAPEDLPVFDASNKVVMPGIVAPDSNLSAAADDRYNVTPDFVALDGFDLADSQKTALSGGVTSAYLSPGRQRLISGQGSVVKLYGDDILQRALNETACLRVNMGDGAMTAPALFEPTVHPTSDDPLLPARVQAPTARISLLAELRRLFRESAGGESQATNGDAVWVSPEDRYQSAALGRVIAGSLPLRISARKAADIRRAILLGKELGVRVVLENPNEIEKVTDFAAGTSVAAVFRVPVMPGAHNRGGEDRRQSRDLERLDAPAVAARAGIPVALAPGSDVAMRDYLLMAAIAIRHGLPEDQALRAITGDAAKILGVDDRVGTLVAGKDADFLVLSGAPFAVGTMVETTFVDGRIAWKRKSDTELLAVRCRTILDGNGTTYRNGVLIAENGRIKAVGENLAIPYGAQVIEVSDAVMVPGMIDAHSFLGLSGEGTGIPGGSAGQDLAAAIRHDDPLFEPAVAAGLTTLLVSGTDSGTTPGRVTAIKTGAADHDSMVVAEIAGLRLRHDAIGQDAIKPLRDAIDNGKKYVDAWKKDQKALAEFEAGTGKKPVEDTAPPAPKAEDPVSGVWEAKLDIQGQIEITVTAELQLEGTKVTGQVGMKIRDRERPPVDITSGSFVGGKLKLEFASMGGEATLEATVQGETMTGEISMGPMGSQPFTANRVSKAGQTNGEAQKPEAKPEEKTDDAPKKPNVDQNLEPWKAIIEQHAAAVISTDLGPAIADVIELFEKEQLPYLLDSAGDAVEDPSLLGERRPGLMLEPGVVRREGRKVVNAAARMSEYHLPVVLVTGDTLGSQHLPIHAAYAVRYGMSPDDALRAVTINPARLFKLDDRIGSLEKGKDADFVVFSGNPFELTSRVLLVGVNGKLVVDQREEEK